MPKRQYAGTSRGGPIVVATRRDVIVECGQVLVENRWATVWLHVDREEEEKEEEREGEKKRENDDEAHRC